MKVYLQFVTARTFEDACIRWGTRSDVSHVDLVIPGEGLLGALPKGGVQIRPEKYGRWSRCERFYAEIEDAKANRIYAEAYAQIGKPYDWKAILCGFILNRDWTEPNHWFCSELVEWCFLEAGVPLLNHAAKPSMISPRDLLLSPQLQMEAQ